MNDPIDVPPHTDERPHRWVIPVLDHQANMTEMFVHVIDANVVLIPPGMAVYIPPSSGEMLCRVLRAARAEADQASIG